MLKNPFAINEKNEIIVIDDLSEEQRGLNCKCRCPACNGEFEARMGNIRVHHFAHSQDGCDEEIAYLTGLYRLFVQFIGDNKEIFIPEVNAFAVLGEIKNINNWNYNEYVKLYNHKYNCKKYEITRKQKITFDSIHIEYNKNKRPICVLAKKGMHTLAIVIQAPHITCNRHLVSIYENYSTLKIDLSSTYEGINNTAYYYSCFGNENKYSWIYNSKIYSSNFMKKIQTDNLEAYKNHIDAERKQREEQQKLSEERNKKQESSERKFQEKEVTRKKAENEKLSKSSQQDDWLYDAFGERLIICEVCGEKKRANEFATYGGKNHINLGICSNCNRKGNKSKSSCDKF